MGANAARSAFWTFFLLLFPLTVHLSPAGCVDYKHREICGLKGSSVELPCTYPNGVQISKSRWFRKSDIPLKFKPGAKYQDYVYRMNELKKGINDCTMRLTNLTEEDNSLYYFRYKFRNVTGDLTQCEGVPGVRLHIFASPVIIFAEKIFGSQKVPLTDSTVTEGQSIMLTCVPTCAANLSYNRGYVWYRNRVQITDSKANLPALSLNLVRLKDTGSYSCALKSYKDLPSSVVNLKVQARTGNETVSNATGKERSKMDSMPTPKISKSKSLFALSIMLGTSVCVGWIITITVSILVFKAKKRRSASSVSGTPNINTETSVAMAINSISHEYDTLDTVRCYFTDEAVYENL